MASKKKYVEKFTEVMRSMQTYRPEFDYTIDVLASICELRDKNLTQWRKAGLQMVTEYTNKAGATNISKSPFFLNNLQFNEQILKYVKALGLTPSDASKLGVELAEEKDDLDDYVM